MDSADDFDEIFYRRRERHSEASMEPDLAHYVIRYYGHFMTETESLAHRHLIATLKSTLGRSDLDAQEDARKARQFHTLLSDDPEVLRLASEGFQRFVDRTASRILAEHKDDIFLNLCQICGALAKTPRARQCRVCRHDWHDIA